LNVTLSVAARAQIISTGCKLGLFYLSSTYTLHIMDASNGNITIAVNFVHIKTWFYKTLLYFRTDFTPFLAVISCKRSNERNLNWLSEDHNIFTVI